MNSVTKGIIGVTLIAAGVGMFGYNRLRLKASYAVLAAPAIQIRSPGDGVLAHDVRSFALLSPGATLGSVASAQINDPDLRAAKVELETARADVASLKDLIALADDLNEKTQVRQTVLAENRTRHLERLLNKANLDLQTKLAAAHGADVQRERSLTLCAQGLMTARECDEIGSAAEVDKRDVSSAQGQVEIASFLLSTTRSGADIGQDMGSEVTYARQRRDDLLLRLAGLRQQLKTREAQAAGLEQRVNPPPIPVSVSEQSRVWSVFHQSQALVVKGEPLFEVVNCRRLYVFAIVSEDRYARLRVDMPASVTVAGKTYPGKIAQLLGPYGTFSQTRGMQPQPPVILDGRDASNAAVAVEAPGLTEALGSSCQVGVRAEVDFEG